VLIHCPSVVNTFHPESVLSVMMENSLPDYRK